MTHSPSRPATTNRPPIWAIPTIWPACEGRLRMLTSGRWAAGVGRPTGGRGGPLLGAVCGPGRAARRLPSPAGAEAVLRVDPGGGAGDGISARLASTAGGETGLIAASVTGATGSGTAAGPS